MNVYFVDQEKDWQICWNNWKQFCRNESRMLTINFEFSIAGSVTRWLFYFSIFDFLHKWKCAYKAHKICQSQFKSMPNTKYTLKRVVENF